MSEAAQYKVVLWTCYVSSSASVLLAASGTIPIDDAVRGGDFALAIAIAFLFINRGYGAQFFETVTGTIPKRRAAIASLRGKPEPASELTDTKRLDLLVTALEIDRAAHDSENRYLAAATFVATLVSGFGDWIATWLAASLKFLHIL